MSLKMPVLTVGGTETKPVFAEGMAFLRANIPSPEKLDLRGATHFLMMEQPSEAAAGLAAFLERHPLD
jgi:3-oxoadipate enol-lactonase